MRKLPAVAVAAALFALTGQVQAATITRTFEFTGTGPFFGGPAPTDPVTGSFTVTLDTSLDVTDQTSGITLNALNISSDSQIGFRYDPALDQLFAYGVENGRGVFGLTNDWVVWIKDATTLAPFLAAFDYTTAADRFPFETATGSVTFQDGGGGGGAPEPAAWALLTIGFAAVGGAMRRRRTSRPA